MFGVGDIVVMVDGFIPWTISSIGSDCYIMKYRDARMTLEIAMVDRWFVKLNDI